ncbi:MAG: acyl-CoA dehydrogenase family protein [Pseudonocardiaceae bacterium]
MYAVEVIHRYLSHREDLLSYAACVDVFLGEQLDQCPGVELGPGQWLQLRANAAKAELVGVDLDCRRGGLGLGNLALGVATLTAGMRDPDAREVFGLGHAEMVVRHGQPGLADQVVHGVLGSGQLVGVASTEPSGGTDLAGLSCRVAQRGRRWVLTGSKGLLSRIDESVGFVVFAKFSPPGRGDELTTDAQRTDPLCAFWVPGDTSGVVREHVEPMGMRGWSWGYLHFDDVELDKTFLLGHPDAGRDIFDQHFTKWRLLMGLACLGAALGAIGSARQRLRSRWIGRRRLADIPVAAHRLGHAAVQVDSTISWCLALLERMDHGHTDMVDSCGAKALATDVAFHALDTTIQLFGAEGYAIHQPFERFLRDIRGLRIADGPNDVLYSVVGRATMDHPAIPEPSHGGRVS